MHLVYLPWLCKCKKSIINICLYIFYSLAILALQKGFIPWIRTRELSIHVKGFMDIIAKNLICLK